MKKPVVLVVFMQVLFVAIFAAFDRDTLGYAIFAIQGTEVSKGEKDLIVATVKDFNLILADFYASGGKHALLDTFPATTVIKHGVFRDLGYIKSANRILVYDLAQTTPVKVALTAPGRAEAVMFEEWNYMYQRPEDRMPLTKTAGLGQGFRYTLVHENGRWLVDGWDPESIPEPAKPKEFLF